jgi:hypothetical protein
MLSRKLGFIVLSALVALTICATGAKADTIVLLGSPAGLGAGDLVATYPEPGGTDVGPIYTTSAGGFTLTFTQSGSSRILVQGGGVMGTSWWLDYPNGTHVLYSGNFFSVGSGPVTITFSTPVSEFGFLFQNNNDNKPSSAVNSFALYNGSTLLGTYTGTIVSTDQNGNVLIFIGAQDIGGGITSIIVSGDHNDFAIGPVTFQPDSPTNDPGPTATPEPGTLLLFGSGLIGLGGVLRRKLRA